MNKKGQVSGSVWALIGVGVAFVVVTLVLAFGLNITTDIQSDFVAGSTSYNATQDGIAGMAKLTEKLPLMATVIVAVLIIGLLISGFMGYMKQ